jgi:hypothetical protein
MRRQGFLVLIVLAAAASGCGPSKAVVKGTVTLDGAPLAEGTINFFPEDGQGATAGGPVSNGSFSVDVPPGAKVVKISASKVVGREPMYGNDTNGPMKEVRNEIIPAKYNSKSELKFEVKPANEPVKYDLTSK